MTGIVLRLGALLMALVVALAAFITTATLPTGIWLPAVVALGAFLLTGFVLLRWTIRLASGRGHVTRGLNRVWWWLGGGAAAYIILAQWLVGRVPERTVPTPVPPADVQYWTLGDGSRIAYLKASGTGDTVRTPVVVLHDGPGMPLLPFMQGLGRHPQDFLSDEGHDVYYYDQLGAGYSSRLDLATVAPYTVARHVADLEEIRRTLNAPRMILIGTGWGSTLAINYLLLHAEHVEKLVLESPTALWAKAWPEEVAPTARAKMTDVQSSALAALQRPPLRLVLGRMISDFSSRAAHRFVADWEGDQWWTQMMQESIKLGQPNYTCRSDPGDGIPALSGLGFFANSNTLANALSLADPRPTLSGLRTDALIIRGTCDYTSWPISMEYLRVLHGSRYVAIPAAGHFIWLEQPSMYEDVVRAFLRNESIPLEVYDSTPRGQ